MSKLTSINITMRPSDRVVVKLIAEKLGGKEIDAVRKSIRLLHSGLSKHQNRLEKN